MITTTYHTPMGDIELVADERGLTGLWFTDARPSGISNALLQADAIEPFAATAPASVEHIEGADAESGSLGMNFEEQCNAAAIGVIERTWGWLNSYFAGQAPLWLPPLHLEGDELAHEVWAAVLAVPYGETIACAELAKRISMRGILADAARVAAVLASSSINLVIPVHRVADATVDVYQAALRDWER